MPVLSHVLNVKFREAPDARTAPDSQEPSLSTVDQMPIAALMSANALVKSLRRTVPARPVIQIHAQIVGKEPVSQAEELPQPQPQLHADALLSEVMLVHHANNVLQE